VDGVRQLVGTPATAYAIVFAGEALVFLVAAVLANNISRVRVAVAADSRDTAAVST
jgi:hypothetical protein